ncbi:iron uptake porin [Phormidium nigroviride]
MLKILCNTVLFSPVIMCAVLAICGSAIADEKADFSQTIPHQIADPLAQPSASSELMDQVTSVSQLSDVQPTDWAFQALQSLVERYGCIAGYPDGTYRGNRALTRYEFAAGLNACLDQVTRLIGSSTANLVTKEDLVTLQKLQEEFAAELATLRGKIDTLEARTSELEANQFSTTTKLRGEVIFAVTDVLVGDGEKVSLPLSPLNPFTGAPRERFREFTTDDQSTVFANRVRLELLTSFTGQDSLKIRLTAGNSAHPGRRGSDNIRGFEYGPNPVTAYQSGGDQADVARTNEGQQTFQDISTLSANNTFGLTALSYEFPITSRLQAVIMAKDGEHMEYVPTTFSLFDDGNGGTRSLSILGQRNPIYSLGGLGAGAGLTYKFSEKLSLSVGYLAGTAENPTQGNGLFDGRNSVLAQLTFNPTRNLSLGLIYNKNYQVGSPLFNNDVGTSLANSPIFLTDKYATNSYGLSALWRVNRRFAIGGWFSYTDVKSFGGTLAPGTPFETRFSSSNADIFSYGITLAFPDLGKEGNLGGIVIGVPPYVTSAKTPSPFDEPQSVPGNRAGYDTKDLVRRIPDRTTPFHIEAFYVYRLTDNILLTPGLIWLTAPNQSNKNPDVVIGTLRATFLF